MTLACVMTTPFGAPVDPDRSLRLGLASREPECHRRPDAFLRIDNHLAAKLPCDPVHGGQAETGTEPRHLGGEERFEESRENLIAHPAPGVADFQRNPMPRSQDAVAMQLRHLEFHAADRDRQGTTLGHRIASVHHEMKHHLLDLSGIRAHPRGRVDGIRHDANGRARESTGERHQLGHGAANGPTCRARGRTA